MYGADIGRHFWLRQIKPFPTELKCQQMHKHIGQFNLHAATYSTDTAMHIVAK